MVTLCENIKTGILDVERVTSVTGSNSLMSSEMQHSVTGSNSQQQHSLFLISAKLYHRQLPILAVCYCNKCVVCSNGPIEL